MSTTDVFPESCHACGGLGFQYNKVTGINEPCPLCGGSGKKPNTEHDIVCQIMADPFVADRIADIAETWADARAERLRARLTLRRRKQCRLSDFF